VAGPEELPGLNRVSGGKAQLARVGRALVGKSPRSLRFLLVPTLLAVAMDVILRGGTLLGYALQAKAIYGSSLLIGAALWALPLWCAARLFADLTPPTPLSLKGEGRSLLALVERHPFSLQGEGAGGEVCARSDSSLGTEPACVALTPPYFAEALKNEGWSERSHSGSCAADPMK